MQSQNALQQAQLKKILDEFGIIFYHTTDVTLNIHSGLNVEEKHVVL